MNKKGFTLIELIIVVIVIGILATFAVPQYMKAVARAKVAKAKNALALISKAEKLYRSKADTYVAYSTLKNDTEVDLGDLDNDADWTYSTTTASATAFTAQADGKAGVPGSAGKTVTLTQSGFWNGTNVTGLL